MLVLLPMDTAEVQTAKLTTVFDVKIWAQLRIEEGELVEVIHNTQFDAFENFSEAVVVGSDGEPVMSFMELNMMVLVAHTQRTIDDIVEAYLFRELHDLAY